MTGILRKILNRPISNITPIWKLLQWRTQQSFRIIYYHMISETKHDYYFDSAISPLDFHDQIRKLKSFCHIISLEDAVKMAEAGESLNRCLAITFDDGFRECHSIAAPVLNEEKIPATFFVTESAIDNKHLIWRNKIILLENLLSTGKRNLLLKRWKGKNNIHISSLLELSDTWPMSAKDVLAQKLWEDSGLPSVDSWLEENKPYMSSKEIKELIQAGFEIGSHSKTHPKCDQLSYEELADELIGSSKRIGVKFNIPIRFFSYPFGIRAKRMDENRILEEGQLISLMGIEDSLNNRNDYSRWERQAMETSTPWTDFFLMPLKKTIIK